MTVLFIRETVDNYGRPLTIFYVKPKYSTHIPYSEKRKGYFDEKSNEVEDYNFAEFIYLFD